MLCEETIKMNLSHTDPARAVRIIQPIK